MVEGKVKKTESFLNKVARWIIDHPPVKLALLILVTVITVVFSSTLVLAMTNKPLFNSIKDRVVGSEAVQTVDENESIDSRNNNELVDNNSLSDQENQTGQESTSIVANNPNTQTLIPANQPVSAQTNETQVIETGVEIIANDNFTIPKCAFTSADFQYKSIPISLKLQYSDGSSKQLPLADGNLTFDHQKLSINTSTNLINLGSNYQTYSTNYSNFPEFQTSISAAYKQWTYTKKINVQSSDNCSLSANLESVKIPEGLYVIATYGQDGRVSSSNSNINGALFLYTGGPNKTYPFSKGSVSVVDQSIAKTPGSVYGFNILNTGKTFIDFTYKSLTARGEITFTKK